MMFKRYYIMMMVHPSLVATKAVDRDKFYKFRNALMNIFNSSAPEDGYTGKAARLLERFRAHVLNGI